MQKTASRLSSRFWIKSGVRSRTSIPARTQFIIKTVQNRSRIVGLEHQTRAEFFPDRSPPSAEPARPADRFRASFKLFLKINDGWNRISQIRLYAIDSLSARRRPKSGPSERKRNSAARNNQPSASAQAAAFFLSEIWTLAREFAAQLLLRFRKRHPGRASPPRARQGSTKARIGRRKIFIGS